MVEINVMMAIIHAQLAARPMLASGTPGGTEDASDIAVAARDNPMIIAILPVTEGGSTRSMVCKRQNDHTLTLSG